MKISLVTPSYNQGHFIRQTLESVLSQTGNYSLEYSIVDGGSTDETVNILKTIDANLEWTSEPDGGQIDAINKGLRAATGDVVGWINSDDLLLPGALQRVANAFADPGCVWVHGDCQIIDKSGREIRKWVSAFKRYHAKRYSFERLLQRNFISQMTVFWRRELLDQVGFLREDFPLAFDYEYWLRLAKLAPPRYVPEPLAAFRWYDESKSGANYQVQFEENLRAAKLHGLNRPSQVAWKRLQNSVFSTAYSVLGRFERAAKLGRQSYS